MHSIILSEKYENISLKKTKSAALVFYFCVVFSLDCFSGPLFPMTGFYLIGIALSTFILGKNAGLIASVGSIISREYVILFVPDTLSIETIKGIANINYPIIILLCTYLIIKIYDQNLKLSKLASKDSLTGLLVPTEFDHILKREMSFSARKEQFVSVAFIDIDNFKKINDTYGHTKGDIILKKIAGVLLKSVRNIDYVARLGGDEFSILFPETTSDEVKYIVSRIRLNLAKDLPNITMSIGVITSKGCDCLSADKLLHDADMLMYDVKRSTKNNVLFKQVEVNPPV